MKKKIYVYILIGYDFVTIENMHPFSLPIINL